MAAVSRRSFLQLVSSASAVALSAVAAGATTSVAKTLWEPVNGPLAPGRNKVTFKSFGVDLAGDLYLPEGFDETRKYKAIVGASPFPQVKDQIPATYGQEMAAQGFIYLGFDYPGMGESPALPGEFKQSRYMFRLIENTRDAVS